MKLKNIAAPETVQIDGASFTIRPLTGMEGLNVMMEVTMLDGAATVSGKGMLTAVDRGLTGWTGVASADGAEIPFSPANVKKLPATVLIDLASRVIALSNLSGDEDMPEVSDAGN